MFLCDLSEAQVRQRQRYMGGTREHLFNVVAVAVERHSYLCVRAVSARARDVCCFYPIGVVGAANCVPPNYSRGTSVTQPHLRRGNPTCLLLSHRLPFMGMSHLYPQTLAVWKLQRPTFYVEDTAHRLLVNIYTCTKTLPGRWHRGAAENTKEVRSTTQQSWWTR